MPSKPINLIHIVFAGLLLAACTLPTVQPASGVTVSEAQNAEITAEWRGDVLIVNVRSESGIGSATVRLPEGDRPRDIIVRLHLSALENLTFAWDAGTVEVAVSSTGEAIVRESFQPAGAAAAEEIDRGSAQWMDVGILSNNPNATPTIPLVDGHFDVSTPRAFLAGDARSFSLSWIDFYR